MAVFSQKLVEKVERIARTKLIRHLKEVGEACVDEAVSNGNYKDNTGNLRSSIGYVVADDGAVRAEGGFYAFGYGDGADIGREKAYLRAASSTGVVLIIVAGMEYAEFVADKGYNVLASAGTLAHNLIKSLSV